VHESYAELLCHELGHRNGWRHDAAGNELPPLEEVSAPPPEVYPPGPEDAPPPPPPPPPETAPY
jgi:hypothetical protein